MIFEIFEANDRGWSMVERARSTAIAKPWGIDAAVAAADLEPGARLPGPARHDDWRTVLVRSPAFVFERMDLTPEVEWRIDFARETWVLCIAGGCRLDACEMNAYRAVFAVGGSARIRSGQPGCILHVAYVADRVRPDLLRRVDGEKRI